MDNVFETIDPLLLASSVGGLILFALIYVASQAFTEKKTRTDVKKRLTANEPKRSLLDFEEPAEKKLNKNKVLSKKVAKKANDFYTSTDPNSVKKLRMMLMQAGYMNPSAVGYFIASRFLGAAIGVILGGFLILVPFANDPFGLRMCIIMGLVAIGYFGPNIYIGKRSKKIETENRQGFPDILDLMVVSAEAGLTMEIKNTYPNLSTQLNMAGLEIRAGRPLDQALRAFGERLRLEEVKGFATMVQQAKELGTSVSDALRVYSEEMRHKRMMLAEEKAYALPAKMSIPVTLFILPIVIGIAIIPTIVRYNI
jgi:tight adherence protein C